MKHIFLRASLLLFLAASSSFTAMGQSVGLFSANVYKANAARRDSIEKAVRSQLDKYPESELCDIYKNFFQDSFGPGHLLSDTMAAAKYLKSEVDSRDKFPGAAYETTGFRGNFYRVNLSLIKDGTVPYDKFFEAFTESAKSFKPINLDAWMTEWSVIAEVIQHMNLQIPNCKEDALRIEKMLKEGKYVMHHSKAFNQAYDFHYRIIERSIFEAYIKPYL